ncbi:EF hand [Labrenzia sp. THAF82]|uniref:EF-hand domain-containing protein n=1 Tax=Labrenzia sp. THAF82 TaxID=2587861 RepID=UPI001269433C|nr:hypothetical protein [Labrenzia sp. THAF82]QFT30444.1 EF hand [Labrenzia sp. THAF82]
MKRSILTIACFSCLALVPPTAAADNDWKELSGLAFQSIDKDGDGKVTPSEYSSFGDDVFSSMDYDSSKALTLDEFYNWGFGMHNAAEDAGQSEAFKTAMRVVFALWDRNADSQVTAAEYDESLEFDFLRADLDQDKTLSEPEYLSGFSVVVAAKAAIHPQSTKN